MRVLLFAAIMASAATAGEVFPSKTAKASDKSPAVLRGTINCVSLPVPDEAELEKVQEAWVLFTPYDVECEGEGMEEGEVVKDTVRVFHLTGSDETMKAFEKLKGKPVKVTGKVFPAHTRYHRTSFLFSAEKVELIDE